MEHIVSLLETQLNMDKHNIVIHNVIGQHVNTIHTIKNVMEPKNICIKTL